MLSEHVVYLCVFASENNDKAPERWGCPMVGQIQQGPSCQLDQK